MYETLIVAIAGLLIAVFSSAIGVGGGTFSVPLIYHLSELDGLDEAIRGHLAVSNSLVMAFAISVSASLSNHRRGSIDYGDGLLLAFGSVVGGFAGSQISAWLKGEHLLLFFSAILLYSAYANVSKVFRDQGKADEARAAYSKAWIPGIGLFVGLVSSLSGIGGGIIAVPALMILFDYSAHRAVATSSFTIILTSLSGILGYMMADWNHKVDLPGSHFGYIYFQYLIPLAVGGLLGGYAGAFLTQKLKGKWISVSVAFFQTILAIKMIYGIINTN